MRRPVSATSAISPSPDQVDHVPAAILISTIGQRSMNTVQLN